MITSRKPFNYFTLGIGLCCAFFLLTGCSGQQKASTGGQDEQPTDNVQPSLIPTVISQQTEIETQPEADEIPAATATPVICNESSGRIEQQQIESSLLGSPLTFSVYLPPCYDMPPGYYSPSGHYYSDSWRYPVLFVFHGQTFTDDEWQRLGVAEKADNLINAGETPPFIIIMPYEEDSLQDSSQSLFGRSVAEELLPWVDQNFPTCTQRQCRAVAGLSRGGAWALQVGLSRWDLFSSIGAHSAPPFQNYPVYIPQWLSAIPQDQMPRIYMDAGRGDIFLPNIQELETFLTQSNVPHEWVYNDYGDHSEDYWGQNIETYLHWYTGVWRDAIFQGQ